MLNELGSSPTEGDIGLTSHACHLALPGQGVLKRLHAVMTYGLTYGLQKSTNKQHCDENSQLLALKAQA